MAPILWSTSETPVWNDVRPHPPGRTVRFLDALRGAFDVRDATRFSASVREDAREAVRGAARAGGEAGGAESGRDVAVLAKLAPRVRRAAGEASGSAEPARRGAAPRPP